MTLNDIIVSALRQLERGTSAQTIDKYRGVFTDYANAAVRRLARRFKVTREDEVQLENSRFSIDDLSRDCLRIMEITENGKRIIFDRETTGHFYVLAKDPNGKVKVFYRFMPRDMTSTSDVPELPNHIQRAIPYYVVACERCGGDPETQGTSSAHFSLFNSEVAMIERETMGDFKSTKLLNRW